MRNNVHQRTPFLDSQVLHTQNKTPQKIGRDKYKQLPPRQRRPLGHCDLRHQQDSEMPKTWAPCEAAALVPTLHSEQLLGQQSQRSKPALTLLTQAASPLAGYSLPTHLGRPCKTAGQVSLAYKPSAPCLPAGGAGWWTGNPPLERRKSLRLSRRTLTPPAELN